MPKKRNYYDTWHATKRNDLKTYPPVNRSKDDLVSSTTHIYEFTPSEVAKQITLLDSSAFNKIPREEFHTYGRKKKQCVKIKNCSNRFNQTMFWARSEILASWECKKRAEILTYFIKLSKCLLELSNFQGFAAIVTALGSAPISRLRLSWQYVSKKDRSLFDKFTQYIDPEANYANLRNLLPIQELNGGSSEKCRQNTVPFLGMFLSELDYMDSVQQLDSNSLQSVNIKLCNISQTLAAFQNSSYDLEPNQQIMSLIQSNTCVEELIKICEADQYRRSMELEPPTVVSNAMGSRKNSTDNSVMPASGTTAQTSANKGHRRAKSLGGSRGSIYSVGNPLSSDKSDDLPSDAISARAQELRHLLDDSCLTSPAATNGVVCSLPSSVTPFTPPSGESGGGRSSRLSWESCCIAAYKDTYPLHKHAFLNGISTPPGRLSLEGTTETRIAGCLRKKLIVNHGKTTRISYWRKYWVTLDETGILSFFPPKSFTSQNDPSHFHKMPSKRVDLSKNGWSVLRSDHKRHKTCFVLTSDVLGKTYRFDAGGPQVDQWALHIDACTNLIKFLD